MRKNKPHSYIVYADKPAYPRTGCKVHAMKIPRGKDYHDMLDFLPPTVVKLKVVLAYSAGTAKAAAKSYGVRCDTGLNGTRKRR